MVEYTFYYSGGNPIRSKGVELLSKADMPVLEKISAGNKDI